MQTFVKHLPVVAILALSAAFVATGASASTTHGSKSGKSGSGYTSSFSHSPDGSGGGKGSKKDDKHDEHWDDDKDDGHWDGDDEHDDWDDDESRDDDGEDGYEDTDAGWTDEGRCDYGTGGDGLDGYHSASDLYQHPENGLKGTSVSFTDNCGGGDTRHHEDGHDPDGKDPKGGKDCYTPAPVPLPATGVALVTALGGLGAWKRRKSRRG